MLVVRGRGGVKKLVLGVTITVCKLRKMLLVGDCMFFAVTLKIYLNRSTTTFSIYKSEKSPANFFQANGAF